MKALKSVVSVDRNPLAYVSLVKSPTLIAEKADVRGALAKVAGKRHGR